MNRIIVHWIILKMDYAEKLADITAISLSLSLSLSLSHKTLCRVDSFDKTTP